MRAIVLTSTLYSDNSYMLNLFTDELGYVVVSVKVGRRSKVRLSHIQPLTLLMVELHGRPSQQVMHVTECVALPGCESIAEMPQVSDQTLPPGGSWQKSALRNRFLTERALSAPVCALGHLSQRERQGRYRAGATER